MQISSSSEARMNFMVRFFFSIGPVVREYYFEICGHEKLSLSGNPATLNLIKIERNAPPGWPGVGGK